MNRSLMLQPLTCAVESTAQPKKLVRRYRGRLALPHPQEERRNDHRRDDEDHYPAQLIEAHDESLLGGPPCERLGREADGAADARVRVQRSVRKPARRALDRSTGPH